MTTRRDANRGELRTAVDCGIWDRGRTIDDEPTTLYRYYDRKGRLLYVGITGANRKRESQHARIQTWWPDVARATFEHYPSRCLAEQAEERAIRWEDPIHNSEHSSRPPPEHNPGWADEMTPTLHTFSKLLAHLAGYEDSWDNYRPLHTSELNTLIWELQAKIVDLHDTDEYDPVLRELLVLLLAIQQEHEAAKLEESA